MGNSKRLAFICLLLFSLALAAIAFHHHDDGCSHDDCPICLASVVVSGAFVGFGLLIHAVYFVASRAEAFEATPRYYYLGLCHPPARAPPA
ncbi:MAG: hypothetical protein P4L43_20655 [Syntrophobacteraceae bacterium]|nr:hypothetical protein [Syntrophobacteraceae bacterium]